LVFHLSAQRLVVVDLSVHRQRAGPVVREEWLVARERVDDGETLVGE